MVTIVVNGTEREVSSARLSYEDVVNLAFSKPPKALLSIVYHGKVRVPQFEQPLELGGILAPGQSTEVCEGMVFNLAHTGNA